MVRRNSTVYRALALTLEMALPTAPQPAHVAVIHALPAHAASMPPHANMAPHPLFANAVGRRTNEGGGGKTVRRRWEGGCDATRVRG